TSMTKTVAPGVRVGALVLPPSLWGKIRTLANDTYIGPSHLAQATVAEYCRAGAYEPGLAHVRTRLRERRDAMVAALERHLAGRVAVVRPAGGYFLWIRLAGVDTGRLPPHAEAAGGPGGGGPALRPGGPRAG